MFERSAGTWTSGVPEQTTNAWKLAITAGAILAGAVLLLAGFFVGRHPVGGLTARNHALEGQLAVVQQRDERAIGQLQERVHGLLNRPHCTTYAGDVQHIQQLIDRGQFGAAAAVANLDLSNPEKPACASSGLAQVWYTASIDDLIGTPPGSPADPTPVLRWESINARADELGLGADARISPVTVLVLAYNNHLWRLCAAAFDVAWRQGLIGASDRTQLVVYYSATTNEGRDLATSSDRTLHGQGLTLLATAAAIGEHIGRTEAASDLVRMLGSNRSRWPKPDAHDVLLAALQKGRRG